MRGRGRGWGEVRRREDRIGSGWGWGWGSLPLMQGIIALCWIADGFSNL